MTRDPRAVAKANRYPVELRPHPDYEYELPTNVVIDGVPCVEFDAWVIGWATDIAERGKKTRWPRAGR